jgi:hypothetical protein
LSNFTTDYSLKRKLIHNLLLETTSFKIKQVTNMGFNELTHYDNVLRFFRGNLQGRYRQVLPHSKQLMPQFIIWNYNKYLTGLGMV